MAHTVEDVQMTLLGYFKETTKRTGEHRQALYSHVTWYSSIFPGSNNFNPLWLPNFTLESAGKSRIRTPTPTLRGAFNYILDVTDILNTRLQDCTELQFKLLNFDDLSMSELEMYEDPSSDDSSIDVQGRRQRVLLTMQSLRGKLQARALSSTCKHRLKNTTSLLHDTYICRLKTS